MQPCREGSTLRLCVIIQISSVSKTPQEEEEAESAGRKRNVRQTVHGLLPKPSYRSLEGGKLMNLGRKRKNKNEGLLPFLPATSLHMNCSTPERSQNVERS